MSLEDFKTSFDNLGKVGLIKFYGTVSENVASTNFFDINEYIFSKNARILTSTNGSLKSKEWWYELGKLYKKQETSRMVFCLDGLHEELSLYRINASYDKTIENATSFIEGGGNAEWRKIVFKHNEHEISRAQETAKKLGFNSFTLLYSQRSDTTEFTYKGEEYRLNHLVIVN